MDSPDLSSLLADGGQMSRPELRRQLVRMLISRREQEQRHLGAQAESLHRRSRNQRAYEYLLERNAELAAACGACVCWGDARCATCGGEGRAGWRAPEAEPFALYIEPALRRLGLLIDAPQDQPTAAGSADAMPHEPSGGDDHARIS